ncbi:MFS transporter [Cellulomonas triticagri]|uniref:MFS transporter n=2 Tax=Cellulomonas triticagri TaxID=2483352 RepID=A0A3M2JMC8_9CELL|nr:MFS transporter [Cellulomonas triticagri]
MVGDTAAAFGTGLGYFATPLVAVLVTGSATEAGIVAAAAAVGGVVGLLPGGVLADRFDRRALRAWSALLGVSLSGTIGVLLVLGVLTGSWLAVLGFALQLRGSLLGPASDAILRSVVGKERMSRAVVANQARDSAVSLVSGPVGGLLYAIAPAVPFVGQALTSVALWVSNRRLAPDRPSRDGATAGAAADFVAGLRFVGGSTLLRSGVVAFALLNLATNGVVMTLVLDLQLGGASPQQISVVTLAVGAGALVGALGANPVIARVPSGRILTWGLVLIAVSMIGVSAAPSFPVAIAVFAVALLAGPAVNATVGGLMMYVIPEHMLGRVMSVLFFCTGLLTPLAPAIAGRGLDVLGYRGTLAAFVGVATVAAAVAVLSRPLRRLPSARHWDDVAL